MFINKKDKRENIEDDDHKEGTSERTEKTMNVRTDTGDIEQYTKRLSQAREQLIGTKHRRIKLY